MGGPVDRSEPIRFDGQVVLVSGAGRGIGRSHAHLFAERGAHVVVNDVDEDVAQVVVDEIRSSGGRATAAAGDVVDDATAIVGVALGVNGRLDALVNNAGIAHIAPFGTEGAADVERLLRVHAVGTAALTAAAWDALIASRGRVVNTTSNSVMGLDPPQRVRRREGRRHRLHPFVGRRIGGARRARQRDHAHGSDTDVRARGW